MPKCRIFHCTSVSLLIQGSYNMACQHGYLSNMFLSRRSIPSHLSVFYLLSLKRYSLFSSPYYYQVFTLWTIFLLWRSLIPINIWIKNSQILNSSIVLFWEIFFLINWNKSPFLANSITKYILFLSIKASQKWTMYGLLSDAKILISRIASFLFLNHFITFHYHSFCLILSLLLHTFKKSYYLLCIIHYSCSIVHHTICTFPKHVNILIIL